MEEKYIVNDMLSSVKAGLSSYQLAITEAENTRVKTNTSANKKQ